jgi:hypothetical protein
LFGQAKGGSCAGLIACGSRRRVVGVFGIGLRGLGCLGLSGLVFEVFEGAIVMLGLL